MEQTMASTKGKRVQGSLLILSAITIGVGSGLGLNFLLPHRGDPLSAAARAEDPQDIEQAESSATADSAVPAPASPAAETAESTTPPAVSAEASPEPESSASIQAPEESGTEPASTDTAVAEAAASASTATESVAIPSNREVATAAQPRMPKTAQRASPPPAAQVLRSWWSSTAADPFAVEYVGQVQGQRAIAILFSRDVSDPAGNLKLIGTDGKALDGGWKTGNSPRLLVRSDLKPGRYTVIIEQQLASADGQSLRLPLRGPIYIQ